MPLTPNTIPSQVPEYAAPFDAQLAFVSTFTAFTATAFLPGSPVTLDLGGPNPSSAAGRTEGIWVVDISAIDFSSNDESYKLALLGSNDVAFGNGNVDLLTFMDFAAVTAGRQVPTVMGPTPTPVPPANVGGLKNYRLFNNLNTRIVYRYVRLHLTVGGTTPSITLMSWLSKGLAMI